MAAAGSGLPEQVVQKVALGERLQATFVDAQTLLHQRLMGSNEWERVLWSKRILDTEAYLAADENNAAESEVVGTAPEHALVMDAVRMKTLESARPSYFRAEIAVDDEAEPSLPGWEVQT
jgi:hypothetical protein